MKNSNVLLIEDDPCHSTLIKYYSQKAGIDSDRIYTATTLSEGMELLKSKVIDVVLLDLLLPDSQGVQGIRKLTQANKNLVIVVLTSLDDESLAAQAMACGAQDYITKDMYTASTIAKAIRMGQERMRILSDLNSKNLTLKKMNRELKLFGSLSCHELKTPVVNLKQLMLTIDEGKDSVEINRNYLNIIQKEINAMSQIVSHVSEVLNVRERNKLPSDLLCLDEVFEAVKNKVTAQLPQFKARFKQDFSRMPELYFPKENMELLMQIFLENALKFSRLGQEVCVQFESFTEGEFMVLRISDNGRGVNLKRYKNKIFGLFQRFHLDVPGRGLGLYLAKELVEGYRGQIEFNSVPNQGTVVDVKLIPPSVKNVPALAS